VTLKTIFKLFRSLITPPLKNDVCKGYKEIQGYLVMFSRRRVVVKLKIIKDGRLCFPLPNVVVYTRTIGEGNFILNDQNVSVKYSIFGLFLLQIMIVCDHIYILVYYYYYYYCMSSLCGVFKITYPKQTVFVAYISTFRTIIVIIASNLKFLEGGAK